MARAGNYRERAAFEREAAGGGLDGYGNPAPGGWSPLVTLWADLRETTGRERIAAGRLEAPATGTLRLRGGAQARGITAADRVVIRGAVWAIVSAPIAVDRQGREIEMTIERGGAVA